MLGQAIVGDLECALFRFCKMRNADDRHFKHADFFGRAQPRIPGYDVAVVVDQDRDQEAEGADAPADLLDLPVGMLARAKGGAPKRAGGHPFDEQVRAKISKHLSPPSERPGWAPSEAISNGQNPLSPVNLISQRGFWRRDWQTAGTIFFVVYRQT